MNFPDVGAMIAEHIRDMTDSGYDDGRCVSAAASTLLTILFMVHENDEEDVIAAIDRIASQMKHGIDSGHLKEFRSVTMN